MSELTPHNQVLNEPAGFWSTKIPSSIAFACCLLLFLLPFIEIGTRDGYLRKLTGIKLATGFTINMPSQPELVKTGNENAPETNITVLTDRQDPNIHALVAFGLGIMGLFLSIVNSRPDGIGGILAGSLAAGALLLLWFNKAEVVLISGDSFFNSIYELSTLTITIWFYLVIVFYLTAAFLSYRRIVLNR